MKVQLIVVKGKPEGKVIPLLGPTFKIGRGETCHLRPNSEQVSREHAEFTLAGETVAVQDLGSRNGTLVNGKAITEPCKLKDRDLVTVGQLTFAVSIQGGPAPAAPAAPAAAPARPVMARAASLDEAAPDDIDSWLVSDGANPTPDRPSGVYGGDTITIAAFKDATANANAQAAKPVATPAPPPEATAPDDDEYERLPEGESEDEAEDDEAGSSADDITEEFLDESNPFHVKKKKPEPEAAPSRPVYKDTSDAANDILRKMMDRRKNR